MDPHRGKICPCEALEPAVPASEPPTQPAGPGPKPERSGPNHPVIELPGAGRVPEAAISFSFVRSAGPGGQNVNKRATKAVMRVDIALLGLTPDQRERLARLAGHLATDSGELVIASEETRSQERNREACLRKLGVTLTRSSSVRATSMPACARRRRATSVE